MTSPPPSPTPLQRPSTSKFRFKQPPSHHSRSRSRSRSPTSDTHRPHRHHHHHRSKRRRISPSPSDPPALNPEAAFRESLFDALADDEGAAFWEGVYGQPIHSYPRPSKHDDTATRELECMTDEEYVAYVRAKMWEKTHQHVIEERARREEERARRKKREEEGRRWEEGVEEAGRRGEERRRGKRWRGAWEGYARGWEAMGQGRATRGRIPWPVLSGRWEDVGKEEVERFFGRAEQYAGVGEGGLGALLKVERVRWHPDKMQQRAGTEGVDGETMKMITAVFQVIDRMWSETKSA